MTDTWGEELYLALHARTPALCTDDRAPGRYAVPGGASGTTDSSAHVGPTQNFSEEAPVAGYAGNS